MLIVLSEKDVNEFIEVCFKKMIERNVVIVIDLEKLRIPSVIPVRVADGKT